MTGSERGVTDDITTPPRSQHVRAPLISLTAKKLQFSKVLLNVSEVDKIGMIIVSKDKYLKNISLECMQCGERADQNPILAT